MLLRPLHQRQKKIRDLLLLLIKRSRALVYPECLRIHTAPELIPSRSISALLRPLRDPDQLHATPPNNSHSDRLTLRKRFARSSADRSCSRRRRTHSGLARTGLEWRIRSKRARRRHTSTARPHGRCLSSTKRAAGQAYLCVRGSASQSIGDRHASQTRVRSR